MKLAHLTQVLLRWYMTQEKSTTLSDNYSLIGASGK
jgi:hypothetical protein